jgi:hypothetical protein
MAKKKTRGRPRDPESLRSQGVDRHTHPSKRFHAPADLFERLTAYCRAADRTESDVLREALAEYLTRRRPR